MVAPTDIENPSAIATSDAKPGIAANVAVIIGASSKIAVALIKSLSKNTSFTKIVAISRQLSHFESADFESHVNFVQCDYSEQAIKDICEQLKTDKGSVSRVFICNGILHDGNISPEKRIDDIQAENLHAVFEVNAVIPMLWIKYLRPILAVKRDCVVTAFSARIGSIEDNRRGGWYSYRASKAALNMLLKTAAIEFSRVAKSVRFLVFHPGTTDTPLSKPFQKFVSEDKLFTPEFVADRLIGLVDSDKHSGESEGESASENLKAGTTKTESGGNIQFLDWDGKPIPW